MIGFFRLIKACSRTFKERFGIRLKIKETEYWKLDKEQDSLSGLLTDLKKKVQHGDCDLVLGVVPPQSITDNVHGIADCYRGIVLMGYLELEDFMKYTILHEFCHIFCAVHLNEQGSIMSKENPSLIIDEFTSKIILSHKNRAFCSNSFPVSENNLDEVISLFKQRADIELGESEVHDYLASLYLEKKKYDQAAKECFKAKRLNPHAVDISIKLGNIYLKQGEKEKAVEEFKQALELSPKSPEIHFKLGVLYFGNKEPEKAAYHLNRILEIDPSSGTGYQILKHIFQPTE
jgi:tetratricopeptide (TPR) repeat protein